MGTNRGVKVTDRLRRLRRYNVVLAVLHAAQGVAILLLANDFSLPVVGSFYDDSPALRGTDLRPELLFDIRIAPLVAAFLFLAAADHALCAGPLRGLYERDLNAGRNRIRWIEYSVSASLMVVIIAMLSGVADVAALLALFGVNASMIMFGLLMERERAGEARWTAFWFGCIAGAVPWIAIGIYLWSPGAAGNPPTFVYAIFVSLFVLFNSFALNMWFQYRRAGPWRDYLFGESAYLTLSLVAKSALAWQVFAGTLA